MAKHATVAINAKDIHIVLGAKGGIGKTGVWGAMEQ